MSDRHHPSSAPATPVTRTSARRRHGVGALAATLAGAALLVGALAGCGPEPTAAAGSKPTATVTVTVTATPEPRPSGVPAGAEGPYRVVDVVDGDTVRVAYRGRTTTVQEIGVNAPEVAGAGHRAGCFGRKATAYASTALVGRSVFLATDPTLTRLDSLGRLRAYLWRSDGTFVNGATVRGGYAKELTFDGPYRYRTRLRHAQHEARSGDRGLWSPATCDGRAHRQPKASPTPSSTPSARPTHHATHHATHRPTHAPTHHAPLVVHPGAWCSPEGAYGVTVKGTPMRCTSKDGDQPRWRAAG